jgi:hypothetical protein
LAIGRSGLTGFQHPFLFPRSIQDLLTA